MVEQRYAFVAWLGIPQPMCQQFIYWNILGNQAKPMHAVLMHQVADGTPLMEAAAFGRIEIAKLLLENKADATKSWVSLTTMTAFRMTLIDLTHGTACVSC